MLGNVLDAGCRPSPAVRRFQNVLSWNLLAGRIFRHRSVSGAVLDEDRQEFSQAFGSFIKLCRATWTVTARVAACLPGNITFAQFAVLEALHTLGPMYQRELSQRILRSSASVTAVVDGLERRGLVSRTRSPRTAGSWKWG